MGKKAYKSYKDEANVDDTYLDGSTYIKEPLLNKQRVLGMFPGLELRSDDIRGDISEFDIELLDKLHAKIDKQISNPKLNVDDLAESMNFSRSTFYRKMRNITGISPKDYLRIYRIRKSVELIETGKYQIAEIADMTGFNTHSHFSMTFKNIMGCSPKEYKNSL